MNNINDLNIKIFDEKIFDKFENNCNDIFDDIFNFIIFIIYKYSKIFITRSKATWKKVEGDNKR